MKDFNGFMCAYGKYDVYKKRYIHFNEETIWLPDVFHFHVPVRAKYDPIKGGCPMFGNWYLIAAFKIKLKLK